MAPVVLGSETPTVRVALIIWEVIEEVEESEESERERDREDVLSYFDSLERRSYAPSQ